MDVQNVLKDFHHFIAELGFYIESGFILVFGAVARVGDGKAFRSPEETRIVGPLTVGWANDVFDDKQELVFGLNTAVRVRYSFARRMRALTTP